MSQNTYNDFSTYTLLLAVCFFPTFETNYALKPGGVPEGETFASLVIPVALSKKI